jgi:hypothetical protein
MCLPGSLRGASHPAISIWTPSAIVVRTRSSTKALYRLVQRLADVCERPSIQQVCSFEVTSTVTAGQCNLHVRRPPLWLRTVTADTSYRTLRHCLRFRESIL